LYVTFRAFARVAARTPRGVTARAHVVVVVIVVVVIVVVIVARVFAERRARARVRRPSLIQRRYGGARPYVRFDGS